MVFIPDIPGESHHLQKSMVRLRLPRLLFVIRRLEANKREGVERKDCRTPEKVKNNARLVPSLRYKPQGVPTCSTFDLQKEPRFVRRCADFAR